MTDSLVTTETPTSTDSISAPHEQQVPIIADEAPPDSTRGDSERQEIYHSLLQTYPVQSVVGQRILREAARHLDLMTRGGAAELAALSLGQEAGESLAAVPGSVFNPQSSLLISLTNPATSRSCQYQGFHLQQYRLLIGQVEHLLRRQALTPRNFDIRNYFPDETACHIHLRTRLLTEDWRCPECNHSRGDWLSRKARWECRDCHAQTGVRWGTVMARSKLPLTQWFHAIDLVVNGRPVSGAELARQVGIERAATVVKMQSAIHAALTTQAADRLLAGIHRIRFQIISLT